MTESRNIALDKFEINDAMLTHSFNLFTNYFIRKSINTITVSLTEDVLKRQNYTPIQIERIKNMVYLTLLTIQGTLHTSGSALGVTELLKYCGYANDEAYWIGFATGIVINLSLDLSSWGIAKTIVSTIGGVTGSWCTQWAYNKYKTRNANTETKHFSHVEEGADPKYQPG